MSENDAVVRPADPSDLPFLQAIEAAADQLFAPLMPISHWGTPPTGEQRAAQGGFILVVGDPVVGFAHVLERDGRFHFEQLAVHPDHLRRGLGTALTYAVCEAIEARGGTGISLMTFADVPWNAPFYERLGFEVLDPAPEYLDDVLERERAAELHLGGRRVAMVRGITPGVVPRSAVSVIPVRDGEDGLEVFIQHRVSTMDFAPGAVVFPGGRIDPVDAQHPADVDDDVLSELVSVWGGSTFVAAADDPRLAVRTILATGLREVHEETGVRLDPAELLPWDDWTTPPGFPKRFQVHFMVAHLPVGDPRSPQNTTTEALASEWLPVQQVLDRGNGGDLQVMTPTRVILQELAELGSADAVMNLHPHVVPVHLDRSGRRPRSSRR
ncbi:GNAT family N-acetyltransferase [Cumulibacter soli]|uniref:GNAT family N-acetyltransferase n=1 Tax=Cumulibacter soli TaxID=2546344 RepID=UPI00141A5C7C|nr:GNAT family N-acetyltransferase [Cumulibacter soli]